MIFLTGDLHGSHDIDKLTSGAFPAGDTLTKDDYVIIMGDFGLIWRGTEKEKYWLNWLQERPWTTLFIYGNHENFDMLNSYPVERWKGGKIHKINESVFHLMRGQVFNIENYSFFTLGGARSVDKVYRVEGETWWPQEIPSEDELEEALNTLDLNHWKVDYVLTHAAPTACIEQLGFFRDNTPLNDFLDELYYKLEYKRWYFGHYHEFTNLDSKHTALYNRVIRVRE